MQQKHTCPSEFHDRAVVASLKPDLANGSAFAYSQFHDRAVVASLKLAGLEHRGAGHHNSTTARSWPH